jgi:hypothetical protein
MALLDKLADLSISNSADLLFVDLALVVRNFVLVGHGNAFKEHLESHIFSEAISTYEWLAALVILDCLVLVTILDIVTSLMLIVVLDIYAILNLLVVVNLLAVHATARCRVLGLNVLAANKIMIGRSGNTGRVLVFEDCSVLSLLSLVFRYTPSGSVPIVGLRKVVVRNVGERVWTVAERATPGGSTERYFCV